jgi:hypothetical protein
MGWAGGNAVAQSTLSAAPDVATGVEEASLDSLPDAPVPEGQPIQNSQTQPGFPPVSPMPRKKPSGSGLQHPDIPSTPAVCEPDMCVVHPAKMCCDLPDSAYARFMSSADAGALTPRQKARLAWRNATDPFNFLTIGFLSAISVAADPHSPYGPGWPGFGRNVGVAYTESAVGEFFGTFLIPAIAHQDPHYHREPNATVTHRTLHAIASVVWAQSDNGEGMPNYANLGTTAIAIGLGDLYVPGAEQGFGAGVERYVTAIASDPISNIVTEFLPDVARHINVRIVLIQRVVDEVERQNGAG